MITNQLDIKLKILCLIGYQTLEFVSNNMLMNSKKCWRSKYYYTQS